MCIVDLHEKSKTIKHLEENYTHNLIIGESFLNEKQKH